MQNRNGKKSNAQRHGAFAKTAILPGESREEFEELHSALVAEWMPVGPTEQDAVLSIANGVWRKRRVQRFLEAEIAQAEWDPNHPAHDEIAGLRTFAAVLQDNPEVAFKEDAPYVVSTQQINYLQKKFPQADFKSTPEWAQAVINEIMLVLIPKIESYHRELGHRWPVMQSSATLSQDFFKNELAVEERLDAMIDRATKRLVQSKAMKQMLGYASPPVGNEQPTKIQTDCLTTHQGPSV